MSACAFGRNCCSASAAFARSRRWGSRRASLHLNEGHSAFAAARTGRASAWTARASTRREAMRRVAAQIVFTTHTPVPAGHDRFSAAPDRRTSGAVARVAGPEPRRAHGAGARRSGRLRRRFLHDGAGAETVASRQCRLVAARPGVARDVDAACIPRTSKSRCRSDTSPTASTCPRGSRRRCARCTTGTSGLTGRSIEPATRVVGKASTPSTMASCGRRIRRSRRG